MHESKSNSTPWNDSYKKNPDENSEIESIYPADNPPECKIGALAKPTIYISVAEHQPYFKGGDGDFVDCIQSEINGLQYNCIRIIEKLPDNFPLITTIINLDGKGIAKIDTDLATDEINKIEKNDNPSNTELENLHLLKLIIDKKIIVLNEEQTPELPDVPTGITNKKQKKLLNILETQHTSANPSCILYIGSRMHRDEEDILVDSGSFFSGNFLEEIKNQLMNNIKIIIFPLEHKFFIRSINTLKHLQCQLEEHLSHADSIHFLNDHDLSYFKKNHRHPNLSDCPEERLLQQKILIPHRHLLCGHNVPNTINIQNDITTYKQFMKMYHRHAFMSLGIYTTAQLTDEALKRIRKIPTCMISGIYTTAQLTCDDLDTILSNNEEEIKTDTINSIFNIKKLIHVNKLCKRPKKILWFGMVRPNKGLDSAERILDLIDKLKSIEYSFVIAGSFEIDATDKDEKDSIFFKLMKNTLIRHLNPFVANLTKKDKYNWDQSNKQITKYIVDTKENIIRIHIEQNKCLTSNEIDCLIYNSLRAEYPNAFDYEIYFGPTPQELKSIALNCRYALKLDDKGMANNASSIVSTLGLFLPTITSIGMLTGNDFRGREHTLTRDTVQKGNYQHTILTGPKLYKSSAENAPNSLTKVEPVSLTSDQICSLLSEETDDSYRRRIEELYELNKPQQTPGELSMFHPKTAATKIIDDIQKLNAACTTQTSAITSNNP